MRRTTPRAAGALALALLPASAHASPQDLFAYGGRSVAMAGTGASYGDDYGAVHANPAGLSRVRARSLTFGYAGTGFDLSLDGNYFPADTASATVIGLTVPLPFGGILRDRIGLGLGFFTPTNVIVRGRILRGDTAQFVVLPDRVQSVAIQAGLGVDLGRGIRVGGGFMALAALTGSVLVTNDASGRSTSRIDDQLIASYAPVIGVSFERGPWRVGATFRGTLAARFAVVISAPELGIPVPPLNIAGVAQYDPAQLQLEGAWQHRGWTVALAVTGKRWSDYPGPAEATTDSSRAPPAPEFSDTLVPRVAVEHRWTFDDGAWAAARGGYFYEPTPAPAAVPTRQYLDTDRHALTLGVGLGTGGDGTRFSFDAFGQAHLLATREGTSATGVALRYGGAAWHLGVTATVTF
jgi:long-subunit fatty acid transport protein